MLAKCRFAVAGSCRNSSAYQPAVEFGFRAQRRRFGGVAGGELVGGLGIALVEEGARDQPPFDPPGVGIDEDLGIARRGEHQRRRVLVLLGAAELLDARVEVERVLLESRRDGRERLVALGAA